MKKIIVAVMAVVALIASTSLSAQDIDDQIKAIKSMPKNTVFNMLVDEFKTGFGKKNVTSDLKKRTITVRVNVPEELGDVTAAQTKRVFLAGMKEEGKDAAKLTKSIFEHSGATTNFIFQGTDKKIQFSVSAADM